MLMYTGMTLAVALLCSVFIGVRFALVWGSKNNENGHLGPSPGDGVANDPDSVLAGSQAMLLVL